MKAVAIFFTVFALLFYPLFIKSVFASDLVINEFLPNPSSGSQEWVEFYNTSDVQVDLSDYYFDDDSNFDSDSASSTKIALSGILPSLQSCYWELSAYLNNNGDSPTLFKIQSGASTIIDSYVYASSSAGLTYARVPDGENWAILQSPTQASNKCLDLVPTPTPTPSPTPTPTSTPTPTPSPTPTPTPTPTPSPSPTPVPTKTPTPTPIPSTPTLTSESSEAPKQKELLPLGVLGESTGGELGVPSPENNLISGQTKKPDTIFQWISITLGIVFIAVCVILTLRLIKKGELMQNEEE